MNICGNMKHKEILKNYLVLLVASYCIVFTLRLLELSLIIVNHGFQELLLISELVGVVYDFLFVNFLMTILYPIYYLSSKKTGNTIFLFFICLFTIIHFFILKYFLYQLIPLDIFLFRYSFDEIIFTIKTSDTSFLKTIILILILLVVIFASYNLSIRKKFSSHLVRLSFHFVLFSLPVFVIVQIFAQDDFNLFSKNKSLYFYSNSISYFMEVDSELEDYSIIDTRKFQKMNPSKVFLDPAYPLLHEFDTSNPLGSCFHKFDSAPNIVILIVEGLNNDFIHNYKGVILMPFLSDLKDKSLYWEKCFTLGERSFAVVSSILGSLPYGEKGFTLLDKLPKHLSLVSILNSNDYYTSFFYGQGSWFHKKDRFFKYNDIDLIFDNSKFCGKYKKIIVGDNNFFWGYNDKDLFNQSLEVIDTVPDNKRLDIYYTGTSHSPYVISDEKYYEKHYSSILKKLESNEDYKYFNTYKKYIKSILFVDDALEDFFHKYEKRTDYDNTIFIITGSSYD